VTGLAVTSALLALMAFWWSVLCYSTAIAEQINDRPWRPQLHTGNVFMAVAVVFLVVSLAVLP
jgi:hypothetical protein